MSFTGNYIPNSFLSEALRALHNFTVSTGDTFKLALYDDNASFTAATTVYTTDNEVTGTGYSAGGATLTNVTPVSSSNVGFADFADVTFSTVTITARGALIYNSTNGNRVVAVLDFGRDRTKTAADFVVTMPTADALNAIIRIRGPGN